MRPSLPSSALVAVVGPTASGKSALAVRLARRLDGEVVNADSRQIYRGMDIGTAKPSARERGEAGHRLIDVADPDEAFSLASYLDLARAAFAECWSGGRTPILTGGTGQYVWAVIEGWQVPRVPPDEALRAGLEARAEQEGSQALLDELAAADPASAARLDPKNVRRIVRALEVHRRTGLPLACRAREAPDYPIAVIGLACEREELYRRIDARVDAMFAGGFVAEVRALIERGYSCDLPAMSSIGYRQICRYFAGELSLEEAIARTKTQTHRLVRMQHNWFGKDDARIDWIDVTTDDPFAEALRVVESKLYKGAS